MENTPSAVAACDNSSAGVYKGIMVGSSGYFKIAIQNGTNEITCDFVFDGKEAILSCNTLSNWTPGQAISGAVFSGTWDGKAVSLTFSCDAHGANPAITSVSVPGHQVNISVYKETSTSLVKCYEGTYTVAKTSGVIHGTWNFIICGNLVLGYHKDSESEDAIAGFLSNTTLTMGGMDGANLTVTETTVSGSFHDGDNNTITVTGKRSL